MNTYVSTSVILLLLAVSAPVAQERRVSLLELAKAQGGTAGNSIDVEFGLLSPPQLLSLSDLVLHGRIVGAKATLMADESFVVTNYEIAPIRVVKQNKPASTAKPGETTAIILQLLGGTLVVDGKYRLTTIAPDIPNSEMPKIGDEMIFFMLYRVDERGVVDKKVYNLANGFFSVFRVVDGRVQPLMHAMTAHLGDKPVAVSAFLSNLQQKVSK